MSSPTPVLRLGSRVSLPVGHRLLVALPLLLLAVSISARLALDLGTTPTSTADVWAALTRAPETLSTEARMVAQFRLPRVVVALLAGAMMAASGSCFRWCPATAWPTRAFSASRTAQAWR